MVRRGQRQSGARRAAPRNQRRVRELDNDGIIPVLARTVRQVEAAVQRGPATPSVRTKFQVVALLVREERARVKADPTSTEAHRAEQLKRLDGVATILATTAARDTSLFTLLAEDAVVSDAARSLRRDMLKMAGVETVADEVAPTTPTTDAPPPRSAGSYRSRSSRDSWPTPSWPPTSAPPARARQSRAGWPAGSCSDRS